MKLKQKIKEIENNLDLKKLFPGYFKQSIFRIAVVLMFVLTALALYSNDWQLVNYYAICESDSAPCSNPYYLCEHFTNQGMEFTIQAPPKSCILGTGEENKVICDMGLCDDEFIAAGTELGKRPHQLIANFNLYVFLIWVLAFIQNHLLYWFRTGNFKYRRQK